MRDLIVGVLSDLPDIVWAGFADTEEDAFEQLQSPCCDVLIVDIELKSGNGINLLRKLAEADLCRDDLKIIFSNNVCDAYRRAGHRYGVAHFFDKSFEMPQLFSLLEGLNTPPMRSN